MYFEVLRRHFGITLAVIGCKGALRRTLGCPRGNFRRFLRDFGSPIGDTFESLFVILCALRWKKYVWIAGTVPDDF